MASNLIHRRLRLLGHFQCLRVYGKSGLSLVCVLTIVGSFRNFSKIAEPVIALTRKHAHFKWSETHDKAFQYLKDSLSVVPLLAYPDTNKPYTLYTDASGTCIGACLTQACDSDSDLERLPNVSNEKPIYYLSHKLSKTQCKWSTVEKEAYAIHYALQKLDHYLHGAQFIIKTEPQTLEISS